MRKICWKKTGECIGFLHLVDGNNEKRLVDEMKGILGPENIEDAKKNVHARARDLLKRGVCNSVRSQKGWR